MARADVQSQVSDHHNVAGGILYQWHDIRYDEKRDRGASDVLLTDQVYAAEPWELGFYLQDRIEYDFITIRLGFRVDVGRAANSGLMFANPLDPTNGSTAFSVCDNPGDWQGVSIREYDPITDQALTEVLSADPNWTRAICAEDRAALDEAARIATADDLTEAKSRSQFSPRLGVTFPVTANSNIFFNFSRFTQNPLYNNQFQGTGIGTTKEGTPDAPQIFAANFGVPFLGNPNLVIEETTQYEVGYLAELFDDYALSLILFSKDQNGLTGVALGGVNQNGDQIFDPGVTYGTNTPIYQVLVNQDFQTVQGVEVSIRKRLTGYWNFDLNYQLSDARTNASPPERETERLQEGDPKSVVEVASEVNQQHVFNGALRVIFGDETPWSSGFWHGLFKNSTASLIVRVASGLPYTPLPPSAAGPINAVDLRQERNSGTAPTTFQLDALLQKSFWAGSVQYGVFLQAVNITDKKNCIQVSPITGACNASQGDSQRRGGVAQIGLSTDLDRPHWVGQRREFLFGARLSF